MGRKAKEYARGMEAGAKPFEEKFRSMSEEMDKFGKKFEQHYEDISSTMDDIFDAMDLEKKKKYYRTESPVDLDVLEKGDREILLSVLFTLAECEDALSEEQQLYIRSVKWYLENTEEEKKPKNWSVLEESDWSILDEIYDVDVTKAVVLVVMEFLFLGYKDHAAYKDEYEDLFDCFSLNRKGFNEIQNYIDMLYKAMGVQGIAEFYGKTLEESDDSQADENSQMQPEVLYGASGDLELLEINEEIKIGVGLEKVYKDKNIIFNKGELRLDDYAKLRFENCRIATPEKVDEEWYKIVWLDGKHNQVSFENCTIDHRFDRGLVDGIEDYEGNAVFNKCRIDKCEAIVSGVTNITVNNSYVTLRCWRSSKWCGSLFSGRNIYAMNSMFDMEEGEVKNRKDIFSASEAAFIENCKFSNLIHGHLDKNSEIKNSIFENCYIHIRSVYRGKEGGIYNCIFNQCVFCGSRGEGEHVRIKFENTEMNECIGYIPSLELINVKAKGGYLNINSISDKILLSGCHFSDWSYDKYKDVINKENGKEKVLEYFKYFDLVISAGSASQIVGCKFENLQLEQNFLIGAENSYTSFKIENCHFSNVQTKSKVLLRREYSYNKSGLFGSKTVTETTTMKISGCTGL